MGNEPPKPAANGDASDPPNNAKNNGSNNNNANANANQKLNQKSDALLRMIGPTFLTNDGRQDQTFAKAIAPNAVIGLYFSAHWCPPCRQFTPVLKQCYTKWKDDNQKIEIIFVSSDRDYDSFKNYFMTDHGSWLAIPYNSQIRQSVGQSFGIRGIPALIFLDSRGNVIEKDGRQLISTKKANAVEDLMLKVPELQFKHFEGTGHSLSKPKANASSIVSSAIVEKKELCLDSNADKIRVQIVCIGGKKIAQELNSTHTVYDVYAHIKFVSGFDGNFQLLAGFPPKALTELTQTVSEAGLKGSRITQKQI